MKFFTFISLILLFSCKESTKSEPDYSNPPEIYFFDGNANMLDVEIHGATLTEDRAGNKNSAYKFDGVDDYIEAVSLITIDEITFTAWIKTLNPNINNRGILTIVNDENDFFTIQGNSARALSVVVNEVEVNEYDWHAEINVWYHIAVVYEGNHVKIYKNGSLTESGELTDLSITGILYIGGVGRPIYGTTFWDGDMSEICLFNYPLSDPEIEDIYQNGITL